MAKIPGGGGGGEARSGGARGTTMRSRRRARGRARGGGGGRRGRGGGAPRAGKEGKGTCVGLFKRLHVPNAKKIRCEVGNLVQLVCELSSFNGDLQSLRSLKGLFPCLLRWLRAFRSCVTCYKPIKSIVGAPMGSVLRSAGWLAEWLAGFPGNNCAISSQPRNHLPGRVTACKRTTPSSVLT